MHERELVHRHINFSPDTGSGTGSGNPVNKIPEGSSSWLDEIQNRTVLPAIIQKQGNLTVGEYLRALSVNEAEQISSRALVCASIGSETERTLGPDLAKKAQSMAEYTATLDTTSHMGILTWDTSVQSILASSFYVEEGQVVIALGCGGVPLDTEAVLRGFVLSRKVVTGIKTDKEGNPILTMDGQPVLSRKRVFFPFFPKRFDKTLVTVAPPFTKQWVESNGIERANKLLGQSVISKKEYDVAMAVMEYCMSQRVLNQESFTDQSTIVNSWIFDHLFSKILQNSKKVPTLVHVELERVVEAPLLADLCDPNSLTYQMFFVPEVRSAVINEANGIAGCWKKQNLDVLVRLNASESQRREAMHEAGTILVKGVDEKGRGYPYGIVEDGNKVFLKRADNPGIREIIPLTPDEIIPRIAARKMIPSLFTCFNILSREAALACSGGPNQTDYLTQQNRKVAKALRALGFKESADKIDNVPAANYSAMGLVTARYPSERRHGKFQKGYTTPAGAIEIMAGGGLSPQQIRQTEQMKVKWAASMGLPLEKAHRAVFEASQEINSETRRPTIKSPVIGFK